MRVRRVLLVQLPAASQSSARLAAERAFPGVEVVPSETLPDQANGSDTAGELLVLSDALATAALAMVDRNGCPRWPVVVLGRESREFADTVPPDETPEHLARVFKQAVLQHELLCENLRLKGDLKTVARRIRHDLFTPVGCVTTSAHVLEQLPPDDRTAVAAMIDNIKVSSQEISQLIDRISFVLRASADAPIPGRVDMPAVVSAALKQLEPDIQKSGATIAPPTSWPEVHGVASWLQAIWWNLLDNALKYGGPDPHIQLTWDAVPGGVRFAVIDHGPGVAAMRRTNLFRPFELLHDHPTPGLGLSIVHRLITLSGGYCDYERRSDGTTVFSFTLPA